MKKNYYRERDQRFFYDEPLLPSDHKDAKRYLEQQADQINLSKAQRDERMRRAVEAVFKGVELGNAKKARRDARSTKNGSD